MIDLIITYHGVGGRGLKKPEYKTRKLSPRAYIIPVITRWPENSFLGMGLSCLAHLFDIFKRGPLGPF
jgi:hypothetical protein